MISFTRRTWTFYLGIHHFIHDNRIARVNASSLDGNDTIPNFQPSEVHKFRFPNPKSHIPLTYKADNALLQPCCIRTYAWRFLSSQCLLSSPHTESNVCTLLFPSEAPSVLALSDDQIRKICLSSRPLFLLGKVVLVLVLSWL